jgi:membrane protease YdiL (CAAX protease family)
MAHAPQYTTADRARLTLWVALIAAPFYLNDFASIFVKAWQAWLAIDYIAVKLLPLALIVWLVRSRRLAASTFGWTAQRTPAFIATFLLAALLGTLIDQNAYRLIEGWPGYKPLGGMPPVTNAAWNWADLTAGLLLVALLEELVFRGAMHSVLSRYTASVPVIIAISALAFGLIHWSLGLHAVLVTGLIGAVFMAIYVRTRSVPALVLAHFVVNFIDFAGVLPKALFKLA